MSPWARWIWLDTLHPLLQPWGPLVLPIWPSIGYTMTLTTQLLEEVGNIHDVENWYDIILLFSICNHASISSKWLFWFTETAILSTKKYFSLIATYLEPQNSIFDSRNVFEPFSTFWNGHFRLQNGHFEEIRAWLQILDLGSNSRISYIIFDTHDSAGLWSRRHIETWNLWSSSPCVPCLYYEVR